MMSAIVFASESSPTTDFAVAPSAAASRPSERIAATRGSRSAVRGEPPRDAKSSSEDRFRGLAIRDAARRPSHATIRRGTNHRGDGSTRAGYRASVALFFALSSHCAARHTAGVRASSPTSVAAAAASTPAALKPISAARRGEGRRGAASRACAADSSSPASPPPSRRRAPTPPPRRKSPREFEAAPSRAIARTPFRRRPRTRACPPRRCRWGGVHTESRQAAAWRASATIGARRTSGGSRRGERQKLRDDVGVRQNDVRAERTRRDRLERRGGRHGRVDHERREGLGDGHPPRRRSPKVPRFRSRRRRRRAEQRVHRVESDGFGRVVLEA